MSLEDTCAKRKATRGNSPFDQWDIARRKRLIPIATMLCQYAADYKAKLLRECDERNKV